MEHKQTDRQTDGRWLIKARYAHTRKKNVYFCCCKKVVKLVKRIQIERFKACSKLLVKRFKACSKLLV